MLKMAREGVTADDIKSWWFVDCILAIGFRIAKDLPPETISGAWMAKYLKRTEKFVHLNWNRLSWVHHGSSSEEPAYSQESNRKPLPFLAYFS